MDQPLRGVLFDAVGTLIELREPVGETYRRFAVDAGVDLSAARIEEAFGRVFAAAPPMAFPGTTPEEAAELERDWWRTRVRETFRAADQMQRFEAFEAFFDALWRHFSRADSWRVRTGARPLLRELKTIGFRLALVSNFDHRLRELLGGLDLADPFEAVVLPADCGFAKPSPEIFLVACERIGCAPDDCTYVGDHPDEDIAGANSAGLRAIDVGTLATLQELTHRLDAPQEPA